MWWTIIRDMCIYGGYMEDTVDKVDEYISDFICFSSIYTHLYTLLGYYFDTTIYNSHIDFWYMWW